MADLRPTALPSRAEIEEEWDRLAPIRDLDIRNGSDVSFSKVLQPTLLSLLPTLHSVLDVGCGTGAGTRLLANRAQRVVGIDPSSRSIAIANATRPAAVEFRQAWVEDYAEGTTERFDGVVANMVLMTMPDLHAGVRAMARLLTKDGVVVCTITHPWFWPQYWGYADASWFEYGREIAIRGEFRTSRRHSGHATTHIHRPLETYIAAFHQARLAIELLREPIPTPAVAKQYPERWQFPRFLALSARLR